MADKIQDLGSYIGLPKYSDLTIGKKGCICKAGLRSAADIGTAAGYVTATTTSTGSAGITYSDNGVKLPANARITLTLANSTLKASMRYNTIIGFTIDADWFNGARSTTEYAMSSVNAGGGLLEIKSFNNSGIASNSLFTVRYSGLSIGNFTMRGIGYERVKCVLYKTPKGVRFYIDNMLVASKNIACDLPADANSLFYIGGRNDTNLSPAGHSISDLFMIEGQSINFPVLQKMRVVNWYGDSKPSLVNYTQTASALDPYLVTTPDDYALISGAYTTANFESNSTLRGAGTLPVCHRELAKKGLYLSDRIHCWAEGGSGYVTLSDDSRVVQDRINSSISNFPIPNVAIIDAGTNDVSTTSIDGTWQTAVTDAIDSLIAVNVGQIIIINQTGRTDQTGATKTANDAQLVLANNFFSTLPGIYSQVKVVDIFNATGGVDPSASYFGDGVHPAAPLGLLLGAMVAEVIN